MEVQIFVSWHDVLCILLNNWPVNICVWFLQLSEDLQIDYESYTWSKLDANSDETRKLVDEYLSWEGDFGGKKFNQGKIFKWTFWTTLCYTIHYSCLKHSFWISDLMQYIVPAVALHSDLRIYGNESVPFS